MKPIPCRPGSGSAAVAVPITSLFLMKWSKNFGIMWFPQQFVAIIQNAFWFGSLDDPKRRSSISKHPRCTKELGTNFFHPRSWSCICFWISSQTLFWPINGILRYLKVWCQKINATVAADLGASAEGISWKAYLVMEGICSVSQEKYVKTYLLGRLRLPLQHTLVSFIVKILCLKLIIKEAKSVPNNSVG